jgi:hypothetical protein
MGKDTKSGTTTTRMPRKLRVTGAEKPPKNLQKLREAARKRAAAAKKTTKVVKLQAGGLVGTALAAASGRHAQIAAAETKALKVAKPAKKTVAVAKTASKPNAANALASKGATARQKLIAKQRAKDNAAIAAKKAAKNS